MLLLVKFLKREKQGTALSLFVPQHSFFLHLFPPGFRADGQNQIMLHAQNKPKYSICR